MAETQVKNRICKTCGVEVRANTLFCYNCGNSVAPEIPIDFEDKKNLDEVRLREKIVEDKNGAGEERNQPIKGEAAADQPIPKPDLIAEPQLKSAAAMRRKSKSYQPKKVEIIWEEHENAPNGWFISAAILLTLFALGILYLAKYLR